MKKVLAFVFGFFACAAIFAQVNVNPQDSFYKAAQNWEIKGVVENLPPVRPYTLEKVRTILETVIANGSENDQELAQEYMENIFGKNWKLSFKAAADLKASSPKDQENTFGKNILLNPQATGNLSFFNDLASVGYKIGFAGRTDSELLYLPEYSTSEYDAYFDPATIGPTQWFFDSDVTTAVGNDKIFGQFGINRSSYGYNLNNEIALNDDCYHMGNLGFTFMGKKWNYMQQYSVIGATHNLADGATTPSPNKFLSFHAAEVYPFGSRFHFSYYEAIVYGKRFDPAYLIPAPYMATQGLNGCEDNLLMGINFYWNIINGLKWYGDVFVDDISVNDLAKLNFDTRIRLAAQTGVIYVPELKVIDRVSLDFTAILPYMYSHGQYDGSFNTLNYQNYTNAGLNIGSQYDPNSGIVDLEVELRPVSGLKVNVGGVFVAHGNIAETISESEAIEYLSAEENSYSSDGTITDHTMKKNDKNYISNADRWQWLIQNHLMYTIQGKLDCEYALKRYKWGSVSFTAGYTAEYVHNKGVDSDIYPCSGSAATAEDVAESYEKWVNSLYDVFNNYFSVGLKYEF